jgi:hypothetical protein
VQQGLSSIERLVGLGDLGLLTTPAMNLPPQHCLRWMARSEIKSFGDVSFCLIMTYI